MENANVIDQEQLENLHADVSATSNGLISVNSNLFGEEFSADVDRVIKRIALTQGFVKSVINGVHKNAILQGPPGLGKSYVVAEVLRAAGKIEKRDYFIVKGHITPMELFCLLSLMKNKGQVVVLDDCDDVFKTELGLNILKAALDPDNRMVSYQSGRVPLINGQPVSNFVYDGTLIICTNMDPAAPRSGRVGQHMSAILSRAIVWPIEWKSPMQKFAQIFNMVVNADYLSFDERTRLDSVQKTDLLEFIWEHLQEIKCLDLRLPQKIAAEMNSNANWNETCKVFLNI